MKKILIPTDFSSDATHAVDYGYSLAKQLRANVILCNVVTVPAEIPQAGLIVWPLYESDVLLKDSGDELAKLKKRLQLNSGLDGFIPEVTVINEYGMLPDVINQIINTGFVDLVVMGYHHSDGLSTFMLGNHSKRMIDAATQTLIIVPNNAKANPVKKIAFAIDLENAQSDLGEVYKLIPLAKELNAEILIVHIQDEQHQTVHLKKWMDNLLTELSNKADYPNIHYRIVKSENIEKGLKWLCEHGQIDMLAMHHHQHGFFDSLMNGSHTQNMAGKLSIPLMVMPA
ncbi:universal stress protein [Mucilaginibacter gilvus]|uniref:Universal stress protein n=1 Tax=Mucilaginibacter gilvus TaxID=2305909 RepID=A0A3S3Z0A8_9SPHI|nr:universal stress protein [Mucilaginibacter gilvus]RWY54344.1 universal stress protein [Mucilaginibacter gilvus]